MTATPEAPRQFSLIAPGPYARTDLTYLVLRIRTEGRPQRDVKLWDGEPHELADFLCQRVGFVIVAKFDPGEEVPDGCECCGRPFEVVAPGFEVTPEGDAALAGEIDAEFEDDGSSLEEREVAIDDLADQSLADAGALTLDEGDAFDEALKSEDDPDDASDETCPHGNPTTLDEHGDRVCCNDCEVEALRAVDDDEAGPAL